MKRRVVITGMGAVSPIGCGVDRMWENAGNGVCGIDYIKSFDTEGMAVKIAAEASDFDPSSIMDKMQARRTARFTQFALAAAKEASEMFGAKFIDWSKTFNYENFGISDKYSADGLHPNVAGHERMFNVLMEQLKGANK